ncbi:MAG: cytochrome c oxidase subunit 3, partial [Pseudomonadota bacterium]
PAAASAWLGGAGAEANTHAVLWPYFDAVWPLLQTPGLENGVAKVPMAFDIPSGIVGAWGLPAINTAILVLSGITVTIAHHKLKERDRSKTVLWLFVTVALGYLFVGLQAYEYVHAINDYNLTLQSGIYGSTFYMLTGFHGAHVTIGATMLVIIMFRAMAGHFTPDRHFAFEGVAWYWHFVDVVWFGLFIFVYWL